MIRHKIPFLFAAFIVLSISSSFALEKAAVQPPLTEAEGASSAAAAGMQGNISLDLRNIEILEAFKFLALKAGLNVVTTRKVAGRVTLTVEDVKVKDIFDIILRSNDLAYMEQGGIYNIMTEEEYKALFGRKFSDIRQVKTFRLKYALPEQAFTLLDTLKSDIGRVLVEPDSGTVLIMDTSERINEIEKALATMEKENLVRVFNLNYARAKDVEEQLKARLDAKGVGSVKADEQSNLVIVQTLPERMREIERLIKALDKKTKEVLIDTKIIKVKLTDTLNAGVEWEGLYSLGNRYGMTYIGSYPFSAVQAATDAWRSRMAVVNDMAGNVGSYPFSGTTTDYSGGSKKTLGKNMHLGIVDGDYDIDTLLNYLQTIGNTQILSNPKLAVVNNQEARIHVGERQAYVTTTTTTGQTTTTVSEEVTFVDVGIQLSVTPTINEEGYIRMKIKPEISSVTSTLITPSKNKIPIIDTSMAETTVLVKDGTTIVIGGLRREEETESREQLPILGDIPLLGFLFRSTTKTTDRVELLIMITSHLVGGDVLTTGNERDFGYMPGKEYKEYKGLTEKSEFAPSFAPPEEKIKPYIEYTNFWKKMTMNKEEMKNYG